MNLQALRILYKIKSSSNQINECMKETDLQNVDIMETPLIYVIKAIENDNLLQINYDIMLPGIDK